MQTELQLSRKKPSASIDADVAYLVGLLQDRDWTKARELIDIIYRNTSAIWHERHIRFVANNSKGMIIGGQKGYKLTTAATAEEYNHYRNWMSHQADDMKRRILLSDKIFYTRKTINV